MTTATAPYITPIGEPSDRPFSTLGEIRTAMTNAGSHWWAKDTLRFFNSRVSEHVYSTPYGTFFVSSERRDYDVPRMYTVRFVAATEVQTPFTYKFPYHNGRRFVAATEVQTPFTYKFPYHNGRTEVFTHNRLDLVETSDDSFQKYASGSGAHMAARRMQLQLLGLRK